MAAPTSSLKAVVAALSANSFVTVIKFLAFSVSGSGAMLSEAIHSLADTGNQLLLFLGLKRGAREADEDFHYGYGGERFVFGILSASGVFFIGCGVTVYHGVHGLIEPQQPNIGVLTFAVLGVAFVVEGGALLYALKAILKQRGQLSAWKFLREKADPAAVAIVLEDSAAVLGLLLAAAGILAAFVTGNPLWDSLGSIVVGLILGAVAVYLVLENRALLLGKAVPDGVEERFVAILRARASVRSVHDVKTRQLTPEAFKLKAEISMNDAFIAEKLELALPRSLACSTDAERRELLQLIARAATQAVGIEIDAIEAAVRQAIPEAKHIDLEVEALPAPTASGLALVSPAQPAAEVSVKEA